MTGTETTFFKMEPRNAAKTSALANASGDGGSSERYYDDHHKDEERHHYRDNTSDEDGNHHDVVDNHHHQQQPRPPVASNVTTTNNPNSSRPPLSSSSSPSHPTRTSSLRDQQGQQTPRREYSHRQVAATRTERGHFHSTSNSHDSDHGENTRSVRHRRTLSGQVRPRASSLLTRGGQPDDSEWKRTHQATGSGTGMLGGDGPWNLEDLIVSDSDEHDENSDDTLFDATLSDEDEDGHFDEKDKLTGPRRKGSPPPNRRKRTRRRKGYSTKTDDSRGFFWRRCQLYWQALWHGNRLCMILTGTILLLALPWIIFGSTIRSSIWKSHESDSPPWYPSPLGGTTQRWELAYRKAQSLVSAMSLVEKVNITTGTGWMMGPCVGNTGSAHGVGFPSLCLQDGPLGIRFADQISAFPAGITTAATWDPGLFYERGLALGREARLKGIHVMLGPSMGPMGIMPAGGRNWEGFGPDPVLSGLASAETIRGIQRNGVMATAKHLVLNEQEHFRQANEWGIPHAMSANIDDRSLREVYLWPFAESIRVNVASVMCSYQMVNNTYACENSKLLNGILKDEMGFQGFVQSDWLAQRSGITSALAGLDMSMPGDGLLWADGDSLWGQWLTVAILNGTLPLERLNDMTTRVVAAWYQLRQDSWNPPRPFGAGGPNFNSWTDEEFGRLHPGSPGDKDTGRVNYFVDAQGKGEHAHSIVARRVAADGIVLVKNENMTLPLSREGGPPLGSGKYRVGVYGEDAGPGQGPNACHNRACNQGTLGSGWGSGAVDFPYLLTPWQALSSAWDLKRVEATPYLSNDINDKDLADKNLCLVFANADSGEGHDSQTELHGDRYDLYLQKGGDKLIKRVADGCGGGTGTTVVVIHNVGPVIMENWIDHPNIKGVLIANLPGQESGRALVDVLFGIVDANGRLPYTIGKSLEDYGEAAQILYQPNAEIPQVNFREGGLYIDYRHFDKYGIEPRYEFGFGLSYTTFVFDNLIITPLKRKSPLPDPRPEPSIFPPDYDLTLPPAEDALFPWWLRRVKKFVYPYIDDVNLANPKPSGKAYRYPEGYDTPQTPSQAGGGEGGNPSLYEDFVEVSFDIHNTGPRTGKSVAQLYVSFPEDVYDKVGGDKIEFPVRVLRGFAKIELPPNETERVTLRLHRKDLSYWSVRQQNWVMPTNGNFGIHVGKSSRDLVLEGVF